MVDEQQTRAMLAWVSTRLSQSDRELCDSALSLEEVLEALRGSSPNKSPGWDGLSSKLYRHFQQSLGPLLLEVFQEIARTGALTPSMRRGVISLVYKKQGDPSLLKNFRPISLLNTDYKILTRVLSLRLGKVLPRILSPSQTYCVKWRDIADTVCSIRDVVDLMREQPRGGYVLKLDQEKAFDRVEHSFLFEVLKSFGFGEAFISWVRLVYKGIVSCVKVNGSLTSFFPVTLPGGTATSLIYQYADDTRLTLAEVAEISAILEVVQAYCAASGAKVNLEKSEVMPVGRADLAPLFGYPFRVETGHLKVLGIYINADEQATGLLLWKEKLIKMRAN